MTSFISNNTHYTTREIVSPNVVRFSIRSTLTDAGVPVDGLIPRFTLTLDNEDLNLSPEKMKAHFPFENPHGLRYAKESNRLIFYFPTEKTRVTVDIQFLPGKAPGNMAALDTVAKGIQIVREEK